MMLPTSPRLMKTFEALAGEEEEEKEEKEVDENEGMEEEMEAKKQKREKVDIPSLLEPENPHKLMYSLQIVEYLSKPAR